MTRLSGGEPDGAVVNPLRFRTNLLIDVPGKGFPEDEWPGRIVRVGTDVVLRVIRPLTRCIMIDMAQAVSGSVSDLQRASRVSDGEGVQLQTLYDCHAGPLPPPPSKH